MTYQEVKEKAKANMGPYCKVCVECNGIVCKGMIPGPGGKGSGLGFIRNYQDVKNYKLRLDTVYEARQVSTKTSLFGKEFELPVFAAPVGAVGLHYSNAYNDLSYSEAVLDGCKMAGSAAFTGDGVNDDIYKGTIKAIKALAGHGIPTIKPWSVPEVIEKAKMAEEAGAFAYAMDIDAAGLAILAMQGKPVAPMSVPSIGKIVASTRLPFILKGIMTAEGAKKALDAGAKGIVVSNHGGRVLDETQSTISVLPEIVKAFKNKLVIFIDGGFRTGLDVFKAMALGADAVLIGRPFTWSVYGAGVEGVKIYLNIVKTELAEAMLMTGANSLKEIGMDKIA